MEGVAADPAFLLFTACYIFLFHTEATMQSMEGVAAELAFLVLIVAWFFNEKWNALKDARMLFERNKRTLRNRISTARQLISSTPSGVCHVLEVDVAVAEELLADGGALEKQRHYEEHSWWFWWVDWWVHGMLSSTLVTDQIAIVEQSISSVYNTA